MAKERLSKLQKWILIEAYKNKREWEGTFGKRDIYELSKYTIYEDYFNIDTKNKGYGGIFGGFDFVDKGPRTQKIKVILSRSLWNLKKKGYIELDLFRKKFMTNIELTENGIKKASELLNV